MALMQASRVPNGKLLSTLVVWGWHPIEAATWHRANRRIRGQPGALLAANRMNI
jgi:hypothetical protein